MSDSVFSKIIKGELPSYKVYEDEQIIAILDIHPLQPGHTLVIPKAQSEQFTELETLDYSYLMAVTQLLAQKIQEVTHCKRVFLRIEGTDVSYTHVHLIPVNEDKDVKEFPDRMDKAPDDEALSKMLSRLTM